MLKHCQQFSGCDIQRECWWLSLPVSITSAHLPVVNLHCSEVESKASQCTPETAELPLLPSFPGMESRSAEYAVLPVFRGRVCYKYPLFISLRKILIRKGRRFVFCSIIKIALRKVNRVRVSKAARHLHLLRHIITSLWWSWTSNKQKLREDEMKGML